MDSTAGAEGAVAAASSGPSIKSCAVPRAVAEARLATLGGRRRPKKKGDRETSTEAPSPLLYRAIVYPKPDVFLESHFCVVWEWGVRVGRVFVIYVYHCDAYIYGQDIHTYIP
jgi:hypothetical protein